MKKNNPLHKFGTLLIVVMAAASAFASGPKGQFERTLQVNGPVDLEVLTRSGDVTIRAGNSNSVFIRGKIYINNNWFGSGNHESEVHSIEMNPPIRQDGNRVHVDKVDVRDISISYEISVPTDTAIRAHSGSGDQIVEGTHGNAEIETGSGDVKLSHLTGELHIQTGSGNLRAEQILGAVHGGTGSGDVELEETGAGDIDVHTGSGNLKVRGIHGAFHGETGSGEVEAEGTQGGPWQINTGSGDVHVRLPGNAAFDADVSTSSGSIRTDVPIETTVQGRVEESRKQLHGKVRGGGQLLRIRTGSGDIHIE